MLASPAARIRPSGPCCAVLASSSAVTPSCRYSASTRSTSPAGATTLRRSDHKRSKISARAMTEARISGQIGHPAAWMMDHTVRRPSVENCRQCSVGPANPQGNARRCAHTQRCRVARPRGLPSASVADTAAPTRTTYQRYVDPEQEERHHRQRAVDRPVVRHRRDVESESVLRDLETERGEQAAPQRSPKRHAPHRQDRVQEHERGGRDRDRRAASR